MILAQTECYVPPLWTLIPFAALLLAIAVLPLLDNYGKFWHSNRNKLLISVGLAVPVLLFYLLAHPGRMCDGTAVSGGWDLVVHVLHESVVEEYLPFIVLMLSLYTISGGIVVRGDLPAHPLTNAAFLAVGAVLANIIGTTGAAMLLIRPLLQTNSQRRHVRHTVIFFIFIVCNVGGCLLPIGDPPLFLGYLKGVPFLWTLILVRQWALCTAVLLAIYYVWDIIAYRRETPADVRSEEAAVQPLSMAGKINITYLLAVVAGVAFLVPDRPLVGTGWTVPHYVREIVLLGLAGASWLTTAKGIRAENRFTFAAIGEVAALFLGIFITMQAPVEILQARGSQLGLSEPWHFFWATGSLSSFLDNAPTYLVLLETAHSLTPHAGPGIMTLANGQFIREDLLAAVSLGAVFMGAMTYIGNGPNFMVKAIAEERGIRMPSFGAYLVYSTIILVPVFALVTWIFM